MQGWLLDLLQIRFHNPFLERRARIEERIRVAVLLVSAPLVDEQARFGGVPSLTRSSLSRTS